MTLLRTLDIDCPYCGEAIEVVVDCSAGDQSYIEDCSVCCRPITLDIRYGDDDEPVVSARDEND